MTANTPAPPTGPMTTALVTSMPRKPRTWKRWALVDLSGEVITVYPRGITRQGARKNASVYGGRIIRVTITEVLPTTSIPRWVDADSAGAKAQ